ncbi:ankyrin repeat-containing domain protein [Ilyonectria destructans]|nr:ankyrin repeat-containing domain protein [Ilyonectria destructans]
MDVGASLAAFITIGVQSAKIIFDTLSAIKDGPEVVARATRDVQRLSTILKALMPGCPIDKARGQDLRQHLQECISDLARYETKLGELTSGDKERRLGKLWKKVKTAASEQDLCMMQSSVASHIAHLNLYLQVRQFDTSFELRKEAQVLSQTFHTNRSNNERRETATFGRLHSIDQRISSMGDVLGKIRSSLDQTSTSTESREIHELLKSLVDQFTKLPTGLENLRQVVESSDKDDDSVEQESLPSQEPYADLQKTISGLCDLVNREMARMSGQQSFLTGEREVLDGLLEFMDCIRSQAHQAQLTYATMVDNTLYDPHEQEYLKDIWNQLKPLYGALLSARTVSLNPLHTRKRKEDILSTHALRFRRLTQVSYDARFWTLDIVTSEKSKKPHNWTDPASCPEQDSASEINEHEVSYSISMTPKKLGSIMKLTLKQYHTPDGITSGIPSLEINRMVPNDSPVFRLVERGKISDLQQLLIRGQASLRDQDEHGASLLQYASWNHRAKMCRFLVAHGADVNHFAPLRLVMRRKNWPNWTATSKSGVYSRGLGRPGIDLNRNEFEGHLECYKFLLNSGADPATTLVQSDSALSSAFVWGQLETMKCFLDHGGLFAGLNWTSVQPDGLGMSLFHIYCYYGHFTTKGFQSLIKRGADIDARDRFGRTCLHLCVSSQRFGIKNRHDQVEALIYLVRCGANVFWMDRNGQSVSQTAYSESIAGDIWDAVLAELGHEVSRFRHDCPRRGKYTQDYTPADFMKLWQGKEELCPYYHDDDLLELCRQFQSGSLDEWRAPGYYDYYSGSDSSLDLASDTGSDTDSDDSIDGGALIDTENGFED